jgi:hypothetical protein
MNNVLYFIDVQIDDENIFTIHTLIEMDLKSVNILFKNDRMNSVYNYCENK